MFMGVLNKQLEGPSVTVLLMKAFQNKIYKG